LHFFPEGGVFQLDVLGGRKGERGQELGKLKWGVGKLIAHSAQPPVVIPFHIKGTEHIVPQDNETKKVLTKLPIPGHKVSVLFGQQVHFDDIIEEHERLHGPLRKFSPTAATDAHQGNFHHLWDSHDHEYELYKKITNRIQQSLELLNVRSKEVIQH
jgi:monolysocardiolipin acyltransferase